MLDSRDMVILWQKSMMVPTHPNPTLFLVGVNNHIYFQKIEFQRGLELNTQFIPTGGVMKKPEPLSQREQIPAYQRRGHSLTACNAAPPVRPHRLLNPK